MLRLFSYNYSSIIKQRAGYEISTILAQYQSVYMQNNGQDGRTDVFGWQFYESALTDHKNAFLFIAKPHEKVHINAWKKSTKRIDLKTEDGK